MATSVIMPRQGQSVESCILSKWHKNPGDAVKIGELLFSYETDKASFDEEAKTEGILLNRLFGENDDVPCLAEVCRVGSEAEWSANSVPGGTVSDTAVASGVISSASFSAKSGKEAAFHNEPVPGAATDVVVPAEAAAPVLTERPANGHLPVSPRARQMAERDGIDPIMAIPTGPGGRILERDIISLRDAGVRMTPAAGASGTDASALADSAGTIRGTGLGGRITATDIAGLKDHVKARMLESQEQAGESGTHAAKPEISPDTDLMGFKDATLPNIRKVIAKAMFHSISTTCQLTLNTSFDATSLLAMRAVFKKATKLPEATGITLTDMVLFGVARTLLSHRDLNAHFLDDRLRTFDHVHLGLAVDTERGLMVPTLFGADTLSLSQLSAAAKAVAKECQTGRISPDKLKGGTFTVSNLGTFGIESFTPVLNPPQTGILGVNNIQTKVRDGKNGLESYPAMGLSLTFDHRALDGAPAARFLKDLTANLEQFEVLLAL